MNRPAPRIRPDDIAARLVLHPSGAHLLEVAAPHNIVSMQFTRDQVGKLKQFIARFEERVCFEDGRSGPEPTAIRSIPLETW